MGFVKTAACPARADVVIGPYGILRGRHRAYGFTTSYRAGGVEPRPYGILRGSVGRADVVIGPYKVLRKKNPGRLSLPGLFYSVPDG